MVRGHHLSISNSTVGHANSGMRGACPTPKCDTDRNVPKRVSYYEDLMALMSPISEKESVKSKHRSCEDTPMVLNCTEKQKQSVPTRNSETLERKAKTASESGDEDWVDVGENNEEEEWVNVRRGGLTASHWWPSIASRPTTGAGKLLGYVI